MSFHVMYALLGSMILVTMVTYVIYNVDGDGRNELVLGTTTGEVYAFEVMVNENFLKRQQEEAKR
jgi:hypothetical protein